MEIGNTTKSTEKENLTLQTKIDTLVGIIVVCFMEKESTFLRKGLFMKENSKITSEMVLGNLCLWIDV